MLNAKYAEADALASKAGEAVSIEALGRKMFNVWRHEYTDYDALIRPAMAAEAYPVLVKLVAAKAVAAYPILKAAVVEWVDSKEAA